MMLARDTRLEHCMLPIFYLPASYMSRSFEVRRSPSGLHTTKRQHRKYKNGPSTSVAVLSVFSVSELGGVGPVWVQ